MTRKVCAALVAAAALGACSPPEITSRLDSSDTLFSGFEAADAYTPRPVGARADNDFMRFSTMGVH
ncbi:hypothetical protein [Pseudooctadecabacter jejudonensis]|uniref:Lipoprotein n=1 Tax=Pseudooctadecabacter jejudonensis TaxID=1391910 RepID=A0A1Y5T3W4_9RHOB|nr:hypothetical protein [Pseudooctadecabacter jejudonensis]SLN51765.1 hypothetical protein PSJ8397_02719 [Pseudooctadecabacter jejudonensis]